MAESVDLKKEIEERINYLSAIVESQGREISILWDLAQARNELNRDDYSQALIYYQLALSSVFSWSGYIDNNKLLALLLEIKRVLKEVYNNGAHTVISIPKSMFEETFDVANKHAMKDIDISKGVTPNNIRIFEEVIELVRRFPNDSIKK